MCVCACVCVYMCLFVFVYVCLCVLCACMHACVFVCVYVHVKVLGAVVVTITALVASSSNTDGIARLGKLVGYNINLLTVLIEKLAVLSEYQYIDMLYYVFWVSVISFGLGLLGILIPCFI